MAAATITPGELMQEEIGRLLEHRKVPLTGMIDDPAAQAVLAMMLFLFDQDHMTPIELLIDSEGGVATSGLAIVDLVREHHRTTHTKAMRYAAGLATVILACGTKGYRKAGQRAVIQITPVTSIRDTPQASAEIARIEGELGEILASCTGQGREAVRTDLSRGRTFDATSALAYGLVDVIVPD